MGLDLNLINLKWIIDLIIFFFLDDSDVSEENFATVMVRFYHKEKNISFERMIG